MKYTDEFPIFSTKVPGVTERFDLSTPEGRAAYFEAKAGNEVRMLADYFMDNTFIAYLLAKKVAGKGTYIKLLREIFGDEHIGHVSIGDVIRAAHAVVESGDEKEKKKFIESLRAGYRGYISFDDALDALTGRTQDKLLPTEFTLALLKQEVDTMPVKSLFVDGFPRELDQVSYALFFRDLINYRDDPDVFIAIDVPEAVIDERMRYRVVCPVCQTPRNTKLLTTRDVSYDEKTKEFYLVCDEHGERMVPKEGDAAGIESIRERVDRDGKLIDTVFSLHGVPRILVHNAVPASTALDYVDDYEITPAYSYAWDEKEHKVIVNESPWTVADDEGVEVVSLLAPAVLLALIKQLPSVLGV
ncbi:nucleoside monophosphate kinase [Candidatus Wolfebacteria bacterium]|nr:nucleoside monophosphate kinase [Candidatus Wolfebacteria bacterium]